ncbi:MAG: hypothetical protein KBT21_01660 [Treponema sp.]|nr:hypothetical protein [Candidatus Treponema merdequi]
MKKNLVLKSFIVLVLCFAGICSCYSPNPLYGKWSDNAGNTITFNPDLTYSAKVLDFSNTPQNYDGQFNIIENVISFTRGDGTALNTEWDLRGSILYLDWTDNSGNTKSLVLYHISK